MRWAELDSDDGSRRAAWEAILQPLAAELIERPRELSLVAAMRVREEFPDLVPDPGLVEQVRYNAAALIVAVATVIERGAPPSEIEIPPSVRAATPARARRGTSAARLALLFQLFGEVINDWLLQAIARSGRPAQIVGAGAEIGSRWVFACLRSVAVVLEREHEAERRRWSRSLNQSRAHELDEIVAGRDLAAQQASARLRYELERHHLALLIWATSGTDRLDASPELAGIVTEVADLLGAEGSINHPLGLLDMAAWLSRGSAFDPAAIANLQLGPPDELGVRIALGEPGFGLEGFRRSHRQAVSARRVATSMASGRTRVTRYGRVIALAALSADAEQTESFVRDTLGPLAGDDDATRRIAATVQVFLEERSSRARAAERLGIHENTIAYRVRQAEEMLGHSIDEAPLEVGVALMLLPMVRPSALREALA